MNKIAKQPVIRLEHYGLDHRIPVLGETEIPRLYKAEELWQDVAYFMGNTINPSPDLVPPVEVSNQDKIVAAGFDLKTSFRHRK